MLRHKTFTLVTQDKQTSFFFMIINANDLEYLILMNKLPYYVCRITTTLLLQSSQSSQYKDRYTKKLK